MELLQVKEIDGTLRIDSRLVAQEVGIEHRALLKLIDTHLEDIESGFSRIAFEVDFDFKEVSGIERRLCCHLTEDQAMFVVTLSRNTKESIACKAKLVKSFSEARKKGLPSTFPEALRLLAAEVEEREKISRQLEEAKPKIEFYEHVSQSSDTFDIGEVSKILNLGIGRNLLFEFLRANGVLMRTNVPYQKYIDYGWFKVVEVPYEAKGEKHVQKKTVVFQSGMNGILRMYKQATEKNLSKV